MQRALLFLLAAGVLSASTVDEWVFQASGWGGDYGKDAPFYFVNVDTTEGVLPGQGDGIAHVDVELNWYYDYLYSGQIHALFNGTELLAVGGYGGTHKNRFDIPVILGSPFTLSAYSDGYFGGHATPTGVLDAFVYSQAVFKVTALGADTASDLIVASRVAPGLSDVPEPATLLLSGLGFLLLWFWASSRVPS